MTTSPVPSHWQARLDLDFIPVGDRTRLIPNKRYGPLSVQRAFYPEDEVCHAYLLHPPGGVAGGDSLTLNVMSQAESRALMTTPGATKFYHSNCHTAEVEQVFHVQPEATLEYLPQENIYFPGGWVDIQTRLSLEPGASAILWEKHCFGRPANGEEFDSGSFRGRLQVDYDGEPLIRETQRIDAAEIKRASGLRNHPVTGTLVAVADRLDDDIVASCREQRPESGIGALTRPDRRILVARYIGDGTRQLNEYFTALWQTLRPAILQRPACHPRIWNT